MGEPSDRDLRRLLTAPEFPWTEVRRGSGDCMVRVSEALALAARQWGESQNAAEALDRFVRANGGRRMKTTVVPITPGQIKRHISDKNARGNEYFRMPARFFAGDHHSPAAS
jgi:hypothetical protein